MTFVEKLRRQEDDSDKCATSTTRTHKALTTPATTTSTTGISATEGGSTYADDSRRSLITEVDLSHYKVLSKEDFDSDE